MLNSSWITSPDCNAETSHFSAAEDALIGFCARIAQILWLQRKNSPRSPWEILYTYMKSRDISRQSVG